MVRFSLTPEQSAVRDCEGSAFISACPGAGKTRTIVEHARKFLQETETYRNLAFLSFTNSAVSELQDRLTQEGLLFSPCFPHFVGTFDSFIWNYIVAPFGLGETGELLHVIPDMNNLIVKPYPGAQGLRLDCFKRSDGSIIPEEAIKVGFNRDSAPYEKAARRLRSKLLEKKQLDFENIRQIAKTNLEDQAFSDQLGKVLGQRFRVVIVDEAQDCNPADLQIIDWLRNVAKISTKVICDPHQSIYGFRGGVTDELLNYALSFPESQRLTLTGNFRSSRNICKAIHMLRPPSQRGKEDEALGDQKDCTLSIHILSYAGSKVSSDIGFEFVSLAVKSGIDPRDCRLVSKTRNSSLNAVGANPENIGESLSLRLASAVMSYQSSDNSKDQLAAVTEVHKIILTVAGKLNERTYHQVITEDALEALGWRGKIFGILRSLHYDQRNGNNRLEWINRARAALAEFLPPESGSIAQRLQNQKNLDDVLGTTSVPGLIARTIHQVKGEQYAGMCVVLTTSRLKGILNHLTDEPDNSFAEDARELYVAASRAEKLLVIACPKSQSKKLLKHITQSGSKVELTEI